ncbi:MAG: hypothetical protein LBJ00_16860 [Planctomycetaceae bacterium]|nr:hypothetical protein [Planctomycetaceae bacterium]
MSVVVLLFFSLFGCSSCYEGNSPARRAKCGEKVSPQIAIREFPIQIGTIGGLEDTVMEKHIFVALSASLPLWHPPSVPSLVHELKLWGKNCHFTREMVGGEGRDGQLMLKTLLSDKLCSEHTVVLGGGKGGVYLVDSPYGIHPIQSGSYDAVEYRAETHFGKLTMLMALSDVPISTPATTSSGRGGTIADILHDTIMNFDWDKELEFVGCSLTLWLPPEKSWTNQFDDRFTFDELMDRLLTIPLGKGTCGGCHVPYTVVTLLRVNEQCPILTYKTQRSAKMWLRNVVCLLEKNQLSDGSWSRDWGNTGQQDTLYGDDLLDKITIVGHHLEWQAVAPVDCRLSRECIKRAVIAVNRQIEQLPVPRHRSFKTILPCSHVAKAMCMLYGCDPFTFWLSQHENLNLFQ